MTPRRRIAGLVLFTGLLLTALATDAAEPKRVLTIGWGGRLGGLDPYAAEGGPLAAHVFETLIRRNAGGDLEPALAAAWKAVDADTWEVRLRRDVRFHDGAPLTAEDVLASFRYAASEPAPLAAMTRVIGRVDVLDTHTLRLHNQRNDRRLPERLSLLPILPRRFAAAPAGNQSGIGTGPFRLTAPAKEDGAELEANPGYWNGRPLWDRVVLRSLPQEGSRAAALESGAVDVAAPLTSLEARRLLGTGAVVVSSPSRRLVFLSMDQSRDRLPEATDRAGRPLPRNPFRDARVRKAVALAVDRAELVRETLAGQGLATTVPLPPRVRHPPRPPRPDAAAARALLAEAGWHGGFSVPLACPASLSEACRLVARHLAAAGIDAKPELSSAVRRAGMPALALQHKRLPAHQPTAALMLLLPGGESGTEPANPGLDALLRQAAASGNPEERRYLVERAIAAIGEDVTVVPLYSPYDLVGLRKGLHYDATADDKPLALRVTR